VGKRSECRCSHHELPLLGTTLGPHVMFDRERPALLCTLYADTPRPTAGGDLRKRITAIYWGSSGRRFKSCQPDAGQTGIWRHRTRGIGSIPRQIGESPMLSPPGIRVNAVNFVGG
jgi:hypothetical protein